MPQRTDTKLSMSLRLSRAADLSHLGEGIEALELIYLGVSETHVWDTFHVQD